MFPKNWNNKRIMEEVAVSWKNMKFVRKEIKYGVLIEKHIGKTTTGMEIIHVFNDGILTTSIPIIKL